MAAENPVPATDGDVYVPMEERTGEPAIVYFTRDLSPKGIDCLLYTSPSPRDS